LMLLVGRQRAGDRNLPQGTHSEARAEVEGPCDEA